MQYWHRRRASRRLPRMRSAPRQSKEPIGSNLVAFKAGMTHVLMSDDSESPSKNMEISRPCTVLEIPETEAYGVRFYSKDTDNNYTKASITFYDKAIAEKLGMKKIKNDVSKLDEFKSKLSGFSDVSLLMVSFPAGTATGQRHPVRFESPISGNTLEEKLGYASGLLGKRVSVSQFFKNGEYVDVLSISIGKGWQGTIKRFGTSRLFHKATQKTRHVGALGAFSPGKVLYTVPQAGQLGFNYRTEHNKRILKMGTKETTKEVNKVAGFTNYGLVKNDYVLIAGSVPGPSKRLVRIRKSISDRNARGIKEPKISYIAQ